MPHRLHTGFTGKCGHGHSRPRNVTPRICHVADLLTRGASRELVKTRKGLEKGCLLQAGCDTCWKVGAGGRREGPINGHHNCARGCVRRRAHQMCVQGTNSTHKHFWSGSALPVAMPPYTRRPCDCRSLIQTTQLLLASIIPSQFKSHRLSL